MRLLDLGCGSGRDCYVLAKLVGATGKVTGVDMTEAQLEVARAHVETYGKALGFAPPLHFVHGVIEDLAGSGIADNSIDVAVSNCVVNLSADKRAVLRGVFQALCNGGEFYQSDIYCDRRLPSSVRQDPVLLGECLGGAMYETDFLRLCREVGFADPREMSRSPLTVEGRLAETLGNAKFFSVTHRLFKLDGLEPSCEEYGQVASYKGTLAGAPHAFTLDAAHVFETGRWVSVCANTALILASSWLRPHFTVMGDTSVHYGRYAQGCAPLSSATQKGDSADCCS
jgi:SAM-dependent methyltransferase